MTEPEDEKDGGEDLEDVAETLETNQNATPEQEDSQGFDSKAEAYEKAYDQWQENDNTELLENLIHQESLKHKYKTLSKVRKKGEYTNYDKLDTAVAGAALTSASYIVHPVLASLWIISLFKIVSDSFHDVESDNVYGKLDDFGPETFYFVVFSLAAGFLFNNVLGYNIVLENGGTLPTIFSEVVTFVS